MGDIALKWEGVLNYAKLFVYPDANKDELEGAQDQQLTLPVKDMDEALRAIVPGTSGYEDGERRRRREIGKPNIRSDFTASY